MRRTSVAACASLVLVAASAGAQNSSFSIDAGTARTRYADSLDATAVSISPAFRAWGPRMSISASATVSQLSGASTNSGALDASLFSPTRAGISAELEGTAGGSAHNDGSRTGQLLGWGRLHADANSRGAWLGAGVGRTWDGSWRQIVQGDIGGWLSRSMGTVGLSISPTVVDDTIKYTDAFLSLHRSLATVDLDASLGARGGSQLPSLAANRTSWGSVGVTWRWKPGIALAVSVGAYPVDLTQGFPGGQFMSVSLRFDRRRVQAAAPAQPPAPIAAASVEVEEFRVSRVSGDNYALRVRAPTARTVELSGDVTTWAPIRLQMEVDGWWTTTLRLTAGTHEIAVRVNGAGWTVPPGLVVVADEFGGAAGLLAVP